MLSTCFSFKEAWRSELLGTMQFFGGLTEVEDPFPDRQNETQGDDGKACKYRGGKQIIRHTGGEWLEWAIRGSSWRAINEWVQERTGRRIASLGRRRQYMNTGDREDIHRKCMVIILTFWRLWEQQLELRAWIPLLAQYENKDYEVWLSKHRLIQRVFGAIIWAIMHRKAKFRNAAENLKVEKWFCSHSRFSRCGAFIGNQIGNGKRNRQWCVLDLAHVIEGTLDAWLAVEATAVQTELN